MISTSTIAMLLQLAAVLLTGAQHNPSMSLAAQQQIVAAVSQTVQLSTQALAFAQGRVYFPVPQNASIWPTVAELNTAPYLDPLGNYVPLGPTVQFDSATVSFGDLNGDGLDDAMVVVKKTPSGAAPEYFLAAMLNQGGILFNIADVPLPLGAQQANGFPAIASHQIKNGDFFVNSMTAFMLLGNQLIKE